MSLSLKHIPCPAGSKCTAFQCIFGHESDKAPAPTTTPATTTTTRTKAPTESTGAAAAQQTQQDEGAPPSSDQQRPRKRLKVGAADHSAPSSASASASASAAVAAAQLPSMSSKTGVGSPHLAAASKAVEGKPRTATRPVSPPPVTKRSGTAAGHAAGHAGRGSLASLSGSRVAQPVKAAGAPPTAPKTITKTTAAAAAAAQPPPKPKKAETLNPRLLKSSPASHEIRLKLLRLVHQEFKRLNAELTKDANDQERKLVLSEQQLIVRALDEEQACAMEKPAVYSNVMKNKVMQYKRTSVAQWKETRNKEVQSAQRKRRQSEVSDGEPKKIETGLTNAQEVQLLQRILTPISELSKHGYVSSVPSEEHIKAAREGLDAAKGWEKCDRCQQRFQVFPGRREEDGALTTGGACNFHWGKTYVPDKLPGDRTRVPKRYHCCGQEVGDSAGCFTHEHHVFKAGDPKRLATVLNFVETPKNSLAPKDHAVCFDCEMCYTVHGLELVRLTATSWPAGEDLLDVLVQPLGEILDLNSRFSGVWPEDLAQAEPWSVSDDLKPSKGGGGGKGGEAESKKKKLKIVSSPEVARDLLFSLISPSTPLIGHGLENDLNAVRIVHPTTVDTVLLYPHKMGLPYRHGLKALMNVHLNRRIQQETGPKVVGHDSAEDARAAGDLVRLKIMEEWKDMQRKGWKVVRGEIAPPESENGSLTEEFIESRYKPA